MKLRFLTILFLSALAIAQSPLTTVGAGIGAGTAGPPPTFTPAFLHMESTASITTNTLTTTVNRCPNNVFCHPVPPTTSGGNTVVFFGAYSDSGSTTLTITDQICTSSGCTNAGDTCTIRATSAAINSTKLFGGECKNVTAGVNQISVTAGASGTISQLRMHASEWNNIDTSSPFDTSSTNTNAGSTTITAGSITPGATNKQLFQYGVRTQTPISASCGVGVAKCFTAGSQSNITWKTYVADTVDGQYMQAGQYSSASAINPQFTMAASSGWGSIVLSYNTASAGSSRATADHFVADTHVHQAVGPTTLHMQMRFEGNTRVLSAGPGISVGTNYQVNSVSSSDSCAWSQTSIGPIGSASSGKSAIWHADNCSADADDLVDIGFTGTLDDYSLHLIDLTGMATAPFVNAYGNLQSAIPAASTITILNGMEVPCGFDDCVVIGNGQQAFNTSQSMSAPTIQHNACLFGGENISGGGTHPCDEENAWFWGYLVGGGTSNYTIGQADPATAVSAMAHQVAFFKTSTAVASAVADDDFIRANVNPLNTTDHIIWTQLSGKSGMKIVSNALVPNSLSSDDGVLFVGTGSTVSWASANDQWASCKLGTLTGTGSRAGIGVIVRGSTSANTGYRCVVNSNSGGNNTFIDRCVAGTCTNIKSFNYTTNWASGQTVECDVVGTTITLKDGGVNGTTVTSVTDANIASGNPGAGFSSTMTAASCTGSHALQVGTK